MRLAFSERPLLLDHLVSLERKDPATVRIVGQIGEAAVVRRDERKR